MSQKKTQKIQVRLSEDMLDHLDQSAEAMGLNRSAYVTYCLKKNFEAEEVIKRLPELQVLAKQVNDIQEKIDASKGE